MIHEAFEQLDVGETLTIVNDHEPKPLFYEFQAEVEAFDAEGYAAEKAGPNQFEAEFPKE